MKLSLSQYPAAIAQAAQQVNAIEHQMSEVRQHLNRMESNAEMVVAFATNLKNDNQRKARRAEVLQANSEYEQSLKVMMHLTTDKANAIAYLEYLRNDFSVAKLETRQVISQQLLGLESRELVGI
jgi:predicted GTPase